MLVRVVYEKGNFKEEIFEASTLADVVQMIENSENGHEKIQCAKFSVIDKPFNVADLMRGG